MINLERDCLEEDSRGISTKKQNNRTDKVYYFRAVSSFQHLKQSMRKEKRRRMLGRSEVELYHELLLVDPEATISPMVFLAFAPV